MGSGGIRDPSLFFSNPSSASLGDEAISIIVCRAFLLGLPSAYYEVKRYFYHLLKDYEKSDLLVIFL